MFISNFFALMHSFCPRWCKHSNRKFSKVWSRPFEFNGKTGKIFFLNLSKTVLILKLKLSSYLVQIIIVAKYV